MRRVLGTVIALAVALAIPSAPVQAQPARPSVDPRVVGGADAKISDVPWQVALLRAGSGTPMDRQFCGGSIISPEWIVTAAHCVAPSPYTGKTLDPTKILVVSGTDDLSPASVKTASQSAVRSIIVHPDWSDATLASDVALLRLDSPLTFGPTRQAIALPNQVNWPAAGTTATISGWGKTGPGASTRPITLQRANVSISGSSGERSCGAATDFPAFDPSVMVCAGSSNPYVTTCFGDSGGPLMVKVGRTPVLAGVTSWVYGNCEDPTYPAGFARVNAFTSWITATQQAAPGSISVSLTAPTTLAGALCAYAFGTTVATSSAIAGSCAQPGALAVTIPNLPPSSYKVLVTSTDPHLVSAWWSSRGPQAARESGASVTVTASTDLSVQTSLVAGGAIDVRLEPAPRNVDSSICLYAYPVGSDTYADAQCAKGNATPSVLLSRLPVGTYNVQLQDRAGIYPTQWYPAKAARTSALAILVKAKETTAITLHADALVATLSGTARDALGVALPGIRMSLTDVSGRQGTQYQRTNASGRYTFAVNPGSYRVAIDPRPEDTYRPDASGILTFTGETNVTQDFTVQRGVSLTGSVVNVAGRPLSGAVVQVHSLPSPTWPDRPTLLMETTSAADGTFAFRSLPPRAVQVFVMGNPASTVRYSPEWYWDSPDRAQAQTIDLTQRTSFAMGPVALEAVSGTPGTLKGRISASGSGIGLAKVEVRLTTEDGGTTLKTVTTDSAGDYTMNGIAPGNYGLDLVPDATSAYLPSYGDIVRIVGGDTKTLNDTLERGGSASGVVNDAQGRPIVGVTVEARISMYPMMLTVAKAVSDSTGTYAFPALPTDRETTFYYTATDLPTYYLPQWYGGSSSSTNAQYVTPTSGQALTLTTTVMTAGSSASGSVIGSVVNEGLNGLSNATVNAYSSAGVLLGSGVTDEDGAYEIGGLPPGSVFLQAVDDTEAYPGFISEWYLDAASLGTARAVTVTGDHVTQVDDIVTAEGAAIRGDFYDYDTDAYVGGTVTIIEAQGATYSVPLHDGHYNLGGLPAGTYTVFASPDDGYLPMWWEYAATQAQAERIEAEGGYFYTAGFAVSKTPDAPVIVSVVKGAVKQRTVAITWEATVGAGTYQLQRRKSRGWQNIASTTNLSRVDVIPASLWSASVCYRLRVVSPAHVRGPWVQECSS